MEKSDIFTPPDGGYGWIIVLATTLINISVLPLVQCFGIIYEQEFEKLGITTAQTAFMLHLETSIYCILGLIGSPLLKKYGFKSVALFGTSLMTVGIYSSAFAKDYAALICTFSVLVGLGHGIMLPATYLATNTYFKKRLTLAVSFSVTGASISYAIMPQVCDKLLKVLESTKSTVLILGCISLVGILCCFLLKPIKKTQTEMKDVINLKDEGRVRDAKVEEAVRSDKAELELLNSKNQIYKETTMPVAGKSIYTKIYKLFNLELLNDRPYVITIIGMSVSFASELNVILMIPFMLPELADFTRGDVALAMSIQSIVDLVARLAVPLIGHHFTASPRVMYAGSLITSTVGRTAMAIFYSSKPTIFFCACLIGLAKGTKAVYQSVIIPKYVALEKLPAANGLNMLLTGLMSLIIGPIIGFVHDRTNSYVYALHAGSVLSMSCMGLWIVHYLVYERNKNDS